MHLMRASWGICPPSSSRLDETVSVLRDSYPAAFSKRPDMSIYRDDIEFRGQLPSGEATLRGIGAYQRLFDALHLARQTTVADADLSFNLSTAECGTRIKVRWHAQLFLRLLGNSSAPLRVDGISIYELDERARVRVHRLEYVERLSDQAPSRLSWILPVPQPILGLAC